MSTKIEKDPIIKMTEKLCETILEQPEFKEIKESITAFTNDHTASSEYQEVFNEQVRLQQKQQQGLPISEEETETFQNRYHELIGKPVVKNFIDAQQAMHKIEQTVTQYVNKTFELERVPKEEDFEAGSCGPSCGCH
ncbi:YlbF family regulator [Bacillus taeanensis]|uniref:YlbF family regulator n=1 Tax=Bacillus taeanensis TaxID=273032 RepID=A0A366Y3H4_9BACI|nr:YlbF family regulator [Bacillus taeanensis]RBW70741.1 hypothetical protein DS031_04460 [Bacillus taeanensis]